MRWILSVSQCERSDTANRNGCSTCYDLLSKSTTWYLFNRYQWQSMAVQWVPNQSVFKFRGVCITKGGRS